MVVTVLVNVLLNKWVALENYQKLQNFIIKWIGYITATRDLFLLETGMRGGQGGGVAMNFKKYSEMQ